MPAVKAGTLYTINFSGGSPIPTSGSFTYDPSTGFSNFTVVWDGFNIDMTARANAPLIFGTGCAGEASAPSYGFAIMSQTVTGCPTAPSYDWQGDFAFIPGQGTFEFGVFSLTERDSIRTNFTGPENPAPIDSLGSWTITAATTAAPEPAGAFLSALGMALLGIAAARQRRRASR